MKATTVSSETKPDMTAKQEAIGDVLDRLIMVDLKGRGAVDILYREARRRAGKPLTMRAACEIRSRVKRGSVAVLCTGFPVRPWISPAIGEADGPPGVAALARAISTGLCGVPLVTAPTAMRQQVVAALRGGGGLVVDPEAAMRADEGSRPTCAAAVIDFPTDRNEAAGAADSDLLVTAIETHQALLGRVPRLVAVDAAFYSLRNETTAKARGVKRICIPNRSTKSPERKREQRKRWFRNGQKWRVGCEGRISVVKRRHGLDRCRYKGYIGMNRWVGLGVIANNVVNIGRAIENQALP